MDTAAIILTGGRSRRFGGRHTPGIEIAGTPVISSLLAAVEATGVGEIVVCGSAAGIDASVRARVQVVAEEPAFGGPLHGISCSLAALPAGERVILVLAGDMPAITASLLDRLRESAAAASPAAAVDPSGRVQFLCAAWPEATLRDALTGVGPAAGRPVRALYGSHNVTLIPASAAELIDIDTPADLARAARAADAD
ncbi:molybdenum cofactor guanylyltransferase [Brevibacterium sp. UBA7493]|uniref:molybdenum cofactor guanylyltransferase n=1 Tax=Brevibacterium sp. UBA7493 TaxID=1946121 RepID=UPI00258055C7|nr:NTP transferase domain-containing protein [Brevibacterium sp. UBA7493]